MKTPFSFRSSLPLVAIPLAGSILFAAALATASAQVVTTWNGGPGNWSNSAFWSNGIPNAPSADARVDGGNTASASAVLVDGDFTVGRLTLDAGDSISLGAFTTLTVASSGGFAGAGTVNNAGDISLNGANSPAFVISGSVTLNGTGSLTLDATTGSLAVRGSGTLTNDLGHTVQGSTSPSNGGANTFGSNLISIINAGLIDANVSGRPLVVDPTGGSDTLVNTGTLRASNGGLLSLTGAFGGTFNNTGGTISALAGSQARLLAADITGGTLSTAGSGTIRSVALGGGTTTLRNLINVGNYVVEGQSTTTLVGTIVNMGTILLDSSSGAGTPILEVNGSAILGGTGSLTLFTASGSSVAVQGTGTLTNSLGHTIQGSTRPTAGGASTFGSNLISIINAGLIDANVTGAPFVVDPTGGSDTLVNTGTLRASNGGLLSLTGAFGGTFNNTDGTISALAGSQVRLLEADITGGTLSTAGSGTIGSRGGGGGTTTLRNLINVGNYVVEGQSTTTLVGTIVNMGTILLDSSSGAGTPILEVNGSAILGGTGSLTLFTASGSSVAVRGTGTLTNSLGHTIQGSTRPTAGGANTFGSNSISIINAGLIDANVSGAPFVIDPIDGAGTFVNTGTLRASNGGVLSLAGSFGGTFDNTGGTISALAGSQVRLEQADITGGTLHTAPSGTIRGGAGFGFGGTTTLRNLTNVGNYVVEGQTTTTFVGTINNSGTILLDATIGGTPVLEIDGDVTLTGGGSMTLLAGGGSVFVRGTGTLTNAFGHNINGSTNEVGGLGRNAIRIINAGVIDANVPGEVLDIDPVAGSGTFVNTGTLRVSNGGILQFNGAGGGTFNQSGSIEVLPNARIQYANGAQFTNYASGSRTLTGGSYTATSTSGNPAVIDLGGAAGNIVTNAASVTLNGAAASFPQIDTIAVNQGSFSVSDGRTFTTQGDLTNSGNIAAGVGGTINVTGAYTQDGGTTDVKGVFASSTPIGFSRGRLVGPGIVRSGDIIFDSLSIAPGTSPGTLTLDGNVRMSSVTTLDFEFTLAPTAPMLVGNNDHLDITGALVLDGVLNITPLAGFSTGTYSLIEYDGALTDNGLIFGNVPDGFAGEIITTSPGNVQLLVTSVPEPSSVALLFAGSLLLMRRWRLHELI